MRFHLPDPSDLIYVNSFKKTGPYSIHISDALLQRPAAAGGGTLPVRVLREAAGASDRARAYFDRLAYNHIAFSKEASIAVFYGANLELQGRLVAVERLTLLAPLPAAPASGADAIARDVIDAVHDVHQKNRTLRTLHTGSFGSDVAGKVKLADLAGTAATVAGNFQDLLPDFLIYAAPEVCLFHFSRWASGTERGRVEGIPMGHVQPEGGRVQPRTRHLLRVRGPPPVALQRGRPAGWPQLGQAAVRVHVRPVISSCLMSRPRGRPASAAVTSVQAAVANVAPPPMG